MDKILSIIKNIPSFSGLNEAQLNDLNQIAINRQYSKGEMIFLEGDDGNGFFLILEGSVKVFKTSSEGKEQILRIFGHGEPFGEVAVFSGRSFPANALALSKSRLLFFPRPAFVNLITRNPSLAMNMLAVLSTRLRQFAVQIESLSLKEIPGRLAAYLIYLAEEQGSFESVTLKISKGLLASLLGTIPETLSRIFAKMTDQDVIEVSGRNIRIINPKALEELAEYGKQLE